MDVSTIWDFCGEVVGTIRPKTGYVPATVTRIDADGTVWVTTGDGGEAPASTCAAGVEVGDVVSVSWSGAQMGVVGNASDPAAGTSTVRAVRKAAESARKVADGAQAIADAIGQHFFTDDNGVHVSTEKDNPTGERNILMNSLGILLRQGSAWLASFSDSAVAFYDGLGNAASNIVAQFGADGARKACGNKRQLYIMREGDLVPVLFALPPSALKAFDNYRVQAALTLRTPMYALVTKITLKNKVSNGGSEYSTPVFTAIGKLPVEEGKRMQAFAQQIMAAAQRAGINADEVTEDAPPAPQSDFVQVDDEELPFT